MGKTVITLALIACSKPDPTKTTEENYGAFTVRCEILTELTFFLVPEIRNSEGTSFLGTGNLPYLTLHPLLFFSFFFLFLALIYYFLLMN